MHQDPEDTAHAPRAEFASARTVLLVDDDELVLAHLSELVTAAGFDVHSVTLPAPSTTGRKTSPLQDLPRGSELNRPPLRTILYIDDEPDLRLIVQAALGLSEGLTVQTGESGEQALELARELAPDLLLLDVMMPGLDGPTTLKRLRADPAIAHIPVVFVTAMPDEVAGLRAMGVLGVIAKPFDALQLSAQVLSL